MELVQLQPALKWFKSTDTTSGSKSGSHLWDVQKGSWWSLLIFLWIPQMWQADPHCEGLSTTVSSIRHQTLLSLWSPRRYEGQISFACFQAGIGSNTSYFEVHGWESRWGGAPEDSGSIFLAHCRGGQVGTGGRDRYVSIYFFFLLIMFYVILMYTLLIGMFLVKSFSALMLFE